MESATRFESDSRCKALGATSTEMLKGDPPRSKGRLQSWTIDLLRMWLQKSEKVKHSFSLSSSFWKPRPRREASGQSQGFTKGALGEALRESDALPDAAWKVNSESFPARSGTRLNTENSLPMKELEIGRLVLSGRAFGPEEVRQVQETVRLFSKLSRFELAQTLCEHLGWKRPKRQNKVDSCLKALRQLEALGLVEGPARRGYVVRGPREPVSRSARSDPGQALVGALTDYEPIELEAVVQRGQRQLWNDYVARYHRPGRYPKQQTAQPQRLGLAGNDKVPLMRSKRTLITQIMGRARYGGIVSNWRYTPRSQGHGRCELLDRDLFVPKNEIVLVAIAHEHRPSMSVVSGQL